MTDRLTEIVHMVKGPNWRMLSTSERAAVDELVAMVEQQNLFAEQAAELAERNMQGWAATERERDQARDKAEEYKQGWKECTEQVMKARTDVLRLRDALKSYDAEWGEAVGVVRAFHAETDKVLADTESYEQYR